MAIRKLHQVGLLTLVISLGMVAANAQSFRVQCPTDTVTHPAALHDNNSEPAYSGPASLAMNTKGFLAPTGNVNGAIKCQQISGGDGYSTMGDGTQTYMFSFGPLSGLADIANGLPGTENPATFNTPYTATAAHRLVPGEPAAADDPGNLGPPISPAQLAAFKYNGAIGQVPDLDNGGAIDGH